MAVRFDTEMDFDIDRYRQYDTRILACEKTRGDIRALVVQNEEPKQYRWAARQCQRLHNVGVGIAPTCFGVVLGGGSG